MKTMGERIKDLRIAYHMSQKEVAEKLEITSGFLGLIERNERGVTNLNIKKLCTLFNVTSDYLILGIGEPPKQDNTDYNSFFNEVMYEEERRFIVDLVRKIIPHRFSQMDLALLLEQFEFQVGYLNSIRQKQKTGQ